MTLDTVVMYDVNIIFQEIGVNRKKILKLLGHQLWWHTSAPHKQDYYVDIDKSHDNMLRLWHSPLERSSRMRKDECSNPSWDRPKSNKNR